MPEDNLCVFVVDDDRSVRESLSDLLGSAGLHVQTFASAHEFLTSQHPDAPSCLVLDVQLPGVSGLDLQQELVKGPAPMPIIFITGHGDIPMTVRAMKAGAREFLTKPFRDEDLLNAVAQAMHPGRPMAPGTHTPAAATPAAADDRHSDSRCSEIVGHSAALRRVLQQVDMVAPTDATVLIDGEPGTGKELIARAIHQRSARRSQAFVALNCVAMPTELLKSELFGHEQGAFPGAMTQRLGCCELANGGTLFLDDIGDLPLELQPKRLRVLHAQAFERLGSSRTLHTNVRLVAATHRDLRAMVQQQHVHEDLYAHVHIVPLMVPPLRARREDIPLLVEHFVYTYAHQMHKRIVPMPAEAMDALVHYDWPGNVRELQHVIERAMILSANGVLRPVVPAQRPVVRHPGRGRDGALPRGTLHAVVTYIEEHLDADLTLAQLAATAHRSPYHFARQFTAATGMPPHQYVIARCVARAQLLLHPDQDLALAEIAARIGFADQSQFTHHFKRIVGVTPGQFRRSASIA